MIKKILYLVKNLILGVLFLYTFDIIISPLNVIIPINIFTIVFVTLFGLPAIIGLCLFSILVL